MIDRVELCRSASAVLFSAFPDRSRVRPSRGRWLRLVPALLIALLDSACGSGYKGLPGNAGSWRIAIITPGKAVATATNATIQGFNQ